MSADANKRMYRLILRSLLRQSREMQKQNRNLWLQRFPLISEFQTTHFTETAIEIPSLINTFPKCFRELLHVNVGSREIDGAELARITKTIYRANPFADSTDETSNLSDAIECLKLVNAQICLSQSSSIKTTENIRIVASAVYDRREVQLQVSNLNEHPFYYRIMIENCGTEDVQLIGRHWLFKSENAKTEVPKFSGGVIGVKPVIKPGKTFQYMSMTYLDSNRGTMEGSFLLENKVTGNPFEVEVGLCFLNPDVCVTDP